MILLWVAIKLVFDVEVWIEGLLIENLSSLLQQYDDAKQGENEIIQFSALEHLPGSDNLVADKL